MVAAPHDRGTCCQIRYGLEAGTGGSPELHEIRGHERSSRFRATSRFRWRAVENYPPSEARDVVAVALRFGGRMDARPGRRWVSSLRYVDLEARAERSPAVDDPGDDEQGAGGAFDGFWRCTPIRSRSIPSEKLLRPCFCRRSIRSSERQLLMERLEFDLLVSLVRRRGVEDRRIGPCFRRMAIASPEGDIATSCGARGYCNCAVGLWAKRVCGVDAVSRTGSRRWRRHNQSSE